MKEDMDVIKAREQVEQMKEGEKIIHNRNCSMLLCSKEFVSPFVYCLS